MREIMVFGSNLAGRHGRGAAYDAVKYHGAIYGQGYGLQGSSFAIPTKDANVQTLPLKMIKTYVDKFLKFAKEHPDMTFRLTPIGTGLAGYEPEDIAPMFEEVPRNVKLPKEFIKVLENNNASE